MSSTNQNEDTSNEDSFSVSDLRSPRQANISLSFSSAGTATSSVLDYSDDNLSVPQSPIEIEDDEQNEGTCTVASNGNSSQTTKEEPPTTRSEEDVIMETEIAKESKDDAIRSPIRTIAMLVEKGADVNTRDKQLRTPLHIACENVDSDSHHDCVSLLLDKGAEVNTTDCCGRTPLHIASQMGCSTCINLLLDHGADTDIKNGEGETALHKCIHQVLSPPPEKKKKGDYDDNNIGDAEVDSHSSVESCPSLLFNHDDSINTMAESSFYQSPRAYHTIETAERDNTLLPYNSLVGKSSSFQQLDNESFMTARSPSGSAWLKNQYYSRKSDDTNIIEEEKSLMDSVSSEGSLSSQVDEEEDDDAPYITWIFQCIEFILHLVWYLLKSTITWLSKALGRQGKLNAAGYISVQPPKHIADDMDKIRRRRQKLE